jgi:hypothetical protein
MPSALRFCVQAVKCCSLLILQSVYGTCMTDGTRRTDGAAWVLGTVTLGQITRTRLTRASAVGGRRLTTWAMARPPVFNIPSHKAEIPCKYYVRVPWRFVWRSEVGSTGVIKWRDKHVVTWARCWKGALVGSKQLSSAVLRRERMCECMCLQTVRSIWWERTSTEVENSSKARRFLLRMAGTFNTEYVQKYVAKEIQCRSQWPRGLMRGSAAARLLGCGFEWMSVVSVVFCQVEVSASGWSPVQRSLTDCGVCV